MWSAALKLMYIQSSPAGSDLGAPTGSRPRRSKRSLALKDISPRCPLMESIKSQSEESSAPAPRPCDPISRQGRFVEADSGSEWIMDASQLPPRIHLCPAFASAHTRRLSGDISASSDGLLRDGRSVLNHSYAPLLYHQSEIIVPE